MRVELEHDVMLLSDLENLIQEVNKTNSQNEKLEVFKKLTHNGLKTLLIYTYDNQLTYGVTSKNIQKYRDKLEGDLQVPEKLYTLSSLLTDLSQRVLTGHKALNNINYYISLVGEEYRETFYRIIDKDLKTRVGVRLLNKIFDNLINQFKVALGESETRINPSKLTYFKERWFSSRKMDGLRCVVEFDSEGEIETYTRDGHKIHTLENLKRELRKLGFTNKILDGEVCIIDENGNENFNQVQKEWNRKNHQIENPKFCMFDFLTLNDFKSGESESTLSQRRQEFEYLGLFGDTVVREEYWNKNSPHSVILLEQKLIISPEQLKKLKEESLEKGWEGLIFRKDTKYIGDRSNDIIKHKLMEDDEFTVVDVEKGPFRVINKQQDGSTLEEEEITMTNVVIDYQGERVSVGSGFSLEQRRHFYLHPEDIVGKKITTQYFEKSVNKEGRPSLRFPIFKGIRTDK